MAGSDAGTLHHVEIWVPSFERARIEWGWLLSELGYQVSQEFTAGCSYQLGSTYIVLEQSPAMTSAEHDRTRPGLNHLAFHAGRRDEVDRLAEEGVAHGWSLLFADKHPYAGGPDYYAAYLENTDRFEVELVADAQ